MLGDNVDGILAPGRTLRVLEGGAWQAVIANGERSEVRYSAIRTNPAQGL